MSITLDLRPETEARLKETAERTGLSLEQYLTGWIEQVPEMIPAAELARLIAESDQSLEEGPAENLEELFARWREEDATDDPEELDRRDAALKDLKANLNANRAATGERLLFP